VAVFLKLGRKNSMKMNRTRSDSMSIRSFDTTDADDAELCALADKLLAPVSSPKGRS
jgi:hypothetical protein